MQQRCLQNSCYQLVRVRITAHAQIRWWSRAQQCAPTILARRRGFHGTSHRQQDIAPLRKELKDAGRAARASRVEELNTLSAWDDEEIDGWELTVGIEIHAQLNSIRKLFSRKDFNVCCCEATMLTSLSCMDESYQRSEFSPGRVRCCATWQPTHLPMGYLDTGAASCTGSWMRHSASQLL